MSSNWLASWLPVAVTAFMAGLLGSGHCFAMCGGIAGSLGTRALGQRRGATVLAASQFNLGRISAYTLVGAITALLLGSLAKLPGLGLLALVLRSLTALLVLVIGLRYLSDWRGLDVLERWGAKAWQLIAPTAQRLATQPGAGGRLLLGLCWGFLPCGLVYTMLLTAASTGDALGGAVVMLAFGVGTLPSMLGLTLAAPALSAVLRDQAFRRFIGLSLVILAAWMMFSVFSMGTPGAAPSAEIHQH